MQPELLVQGSGHSGDLVGYVFPNLGGRLSRRSPDSLREKGMKTWARGAFCPAGPERPISAFEDREFGVIPGREKPLPKRRECCLIKAAAGRRENSPLKKKAFH